MFDLIRLKYSKSVCYYNETSETRDKEKDGYSHCDIN